MSLSIGVGDGSSLCPLQGEPSLYLDDDGYYWFLEPLFEQLAVETNQYIDLYGDAAFGGENLPALLRKLSQAHALVAGQPESWEVHTGTQVKPVHKEFYALVKRKRFLELLDQFEQIAYRAQRTHSQVVCFGD